MALYLNAHQIVVKFVCLPFAALASGGFIRALISMQTAAYFVWK